MTCLKGHQDEKHRGKDRSKVASRRKTTLRREAASRGTGLSYELSLTATNDGGDVREASRMIKRKRGGEKERECQRKRKEVKIR